MTKNASRWFRPMGVLVALLAMSGCVQQGSRSSAKMPQSPGLYPQATSTAPNQPNLSGIWLLQEFALSTQPAAKRKTRDVNGEEAPLQPWARTLYQKRADETDQGKPFADTASRCLPNGMPLMMYDAPYPMQLIQQPGQVTMLFEEETTFRIIYLDEKLPEDPDITYAGRSVGHFEGDTLVVQTAGLNADTTLDTLGMPHTEKLMVTERIRRPQPKLLEDLLTFDDPGTFTRPWTIRRTYKLWPVEKKILEYVCNDNQRNSPQADGHSSFGK